MALPIEYQRSASQDRDAAIRQYAPLVKYVVGRLAIGLPAILDYEDILSYGTIGLIEALDRFDDSKGVIESNSVIPHKINLLTFPFFDSKLNHCFRCCACKLKGIVKQIVENNS